jgi:formate-nitrite transporter family protein
MTDTRHVPSSSLGSQEREDVDSISAPRTLIVHEAVRKEGEEELSRPASSLMWSGLAAGLSMGFSMVGDGSGATHETGWRDLTIYWGVTVLSLSLLPRYPRSVQATRRALISV